MNVMNVCDTAVPYVSVPVVVAPPVAFWAYQIVAVLKAVCVAAK